MKKILFLLLFVAPSVNAACLVVTPNGTGAKNGTNWSNAYAKLPATLIRGNVYYVADGNYGGYAFNTSNSGTNAVEIRKAQTFDHCNDTGWNDGTMGSAQAVFTGFAIQTNYLTLNGNGSFPGSGCGNSPGATMAGPPPNPADCGIKVDNSGCSGGMDACDGPITLGNFNTSASNTGTQMRYVEVKGNGNNDSERMLIWAPFNRGVANTGGSFSHIYGHYAGCVYFQNGADGRSVTDSYFWGTEPNGGQGSDPCHGQYSYYDLSDSNGTEARNVYRDITGTAVHTFGTNGTHSGWKFYDNVYFNTAFGGALGNYSDGIIACINNTSNCNNFTFVNNVGIQLHGNCGINNEHTGSYTVRNNIWYSMSCVPAFTGGTGGAYTQDHNSFLNLGTNCPSGTANVCNNSSPNPFVNWPSGNFNLASDNANWNNRLALAAPYNVDAAGNTFTTSRGAYQFGGIVPPPTPVTISTTSLPGGVVGVPYSATLTASGGVPPYLWTSSALPSGISLSVGGVLAGTPTAAGFTTATFTVTAGTTASAPLSITIAAAPPPNTCVSSSAAFKNNPFPAQTGTFTVEYDATPSQQTMDSVFGLSNGPATSYDSNAVATRFESSRIDARNGDVYTPIPNMPFTAGVTYHFKLVVRRAAHTYDVFVNVAGSSVVNSLANLKFRTQQSTVAQLSNWSLVAIQGVQQVCNFTLNTTPPPPPPTLLLTCVGLVCTYTPTNMPPGTLIPTSGSALGVSANATAQVP